MGTRSAIIEGLREKREAGSKSDNVNRKQQNALQVISEKRLNNFAKNRASSHKAAICPKIHPKQIKESTEYAPKNMDEMPKSKMEASVIIAYDNGDRYVGEVRDGVPDGNGTITSAHGHMYDGGFKNGQQHGDGIYIWPDGLIFIGVWKNNGNAKGTFYGIDGDEYDGEWKNGELLKIEGSICDKAAS